MINLLKYRFVVISLVFIFTLFNIGVPIVLASCPMMQEQGIEASCCLEIPQSDYPIVKTNQDYSCCITIIAAERNTTEFLQKQDNGITQLLNNSSTSILHFSQNLESKHYSKIILKETHSLPFFEDIPILYSSLLI